jgi:hypothetical protein
MDAKRLFVSWVWPLRRGPPSSRRPLSCRAAPQATLLGEKLYVFGGEDCSRCPLADLFVLDLATLAWTKLEPPGKQHAKPPPRCGHAAVVCRDKLIVFGGAPPRARRAAGRARCATNGTRQAAPPLPRCFTQPLP